MGQVYGDVKQKRERETRVSIVAGKQKDRVKVDVA
jgi:hypothetical protein